MRRFITLFAAFLVSGYVLFAQNDLFNSRGSLPPYFNPVKPHEKAHFTSPVKPEFAIPEYPEHNSKSGKEGAVEVELSVTAEGNVVFAEITVSSGDRLFDEAALRSAMKSRFPAGFATVAGQSRDFKITVPFYFLLSSDPEQYWHTRLELARVQQDYELVMKEFQDYLSSRTVATKSRLEHAKNEVEQKVACAKKLHRILAEKKETAILRLREEISTGKFVSESHAPVEETVRSREWRKSHSPIQSAQIEIGPAHRGVITVSQITQNERDRLNLELEIKKSYL